MLEFLIDNIYIRVGKEIFRQQVGIPMGTDCAPFLANLFLFYFEYNYMKDLIKSNIHLAKQFSYTTRYIDDLLTLNNNRFTKVIPNIYPPELELKRTTESPTMLSYLDILIIIENGKYHTTNFYKRDNFGFTIVNFPHLCSNIPTKPAYGVYVSQLIRIGRICNSFTDRHYKLTTRLIQQGFWYTKLCFIFTKFLEYMHLFFLNLIVEYANILRKVFACRLMLGWD